MKPKIAIICSVLPPFKDAVGEGAIKLKDLLVENGHSAGIITSLNQIESHDIFPIVKKWNFFGVLKILQFLKKENIQIIILEYPSALYKRNISINIFPIFCRIYRIKVITYLHEYENYSKFGKLRIIPLLLFSNTIITTDNGNYNNLYNHPFLWARLSLLSIGSNFRDELFLKANSLEKKETIFNNKLRLLYFGFIMEGKGLENFISLSERVENINLEFVVIGSLPENSSPVANKLFEKIKKSNLIKYYGYVDEKELIEYFSRIDIVYLPYNNGVTERRGSFMVAMGFGKMVITTKPQFNIYGLIDGENVFFLDDLSNESFNSIVKKIKELEESKIKKIKVAAYTWYMENYSDKIFLEKFLRIFKI